MSVVLLPSASILASTGITLEFIRDALLGVNEILTVLLTVLLSIVAEIVAVVRDVEDVNVAVYVPFPWSVVVLIEPAFVESITFCPLKVVVFKPASIACNVMVVVAAPLAVIEVSAVVIVEFAADAGKLSGPAF